MQMFARAYFVMGAISRLINLICLGDRKNKIMIWRYLGSVYTYYKNLTLSGRVSPFRVPKFFVLEFNFFWFRQIVRSKNHEQCRVHCLVCVYRCVSKGFVGMEGL